MEPDISNAYVSTGHVLRLSLDGLKMILKPKRSQYAYEVIFARASLLDTFNVQETLMPGTQATGTLSDSLALSASSNF